MQAVRRTLPAKGQGGGAERNRTAGLLIANEALSQLSYSPKPCLVPGQPGHGGGI